MFKRKKEDFFISIIFIFFFLSYGYSQNTHRFIYEMQYKLDSTSKVFEKEFMVLDISKNTVKFYDYPFLKYDSINKSTGSKWQTNSQTNQIITRVLNSNENNSYRDIGFDYFLIKSKDEIRWKIENETKRVSDYKLQKATCDFGGRKWVAWFCSEIPFQEGPYKFRGLPGLIFEIEDVNKNFIYKLVKSLNLFKEVITNEFIETHYGIKPILITEQQYKRLLLEKYSDPVANMRNILKNGGFVNLNNQVIKSIDQLDIQKRAMQLSIKKNYNPIELNNAVKY